MLATASSDQLMPGTHPANFARRLTEKASSNNGCTPRLNLQALVANSVASGWEVTAQLHHVRNSLLPSQHVLATDSGLYAPPLA